MVKNPPTNAGDARDVVVQEDPLEEEMATHSRILAWEMPRAEEPGRLQSTGVTKESDTTSQLNNEIEVHLLHGRP